MICSTDIFTPISALNKFAWVTLYMGKINTLHLSVWNHNLWLYSQTILSYFLTIYLLFVEKLWIPTKLRSWQALSEAIQSLQLTYLLTNCGPPICRMGYMRLHFCELCNFSCNRPRVNLITGYIAKTYSFGKELG